MSPMSPSDALRLIAKRECAVQAATGVACGELGLPLEGDPDDVHVAVACAACVAKAAMLTMSAAF